MKLLTCFGASITLLILSQPLAAVVVVPCEEGVDRSADLQDAVDEAEASDRVVQLEGCDYIVDAESVEITTPITIRGRGRQTTVLKSVMDGQLSPAPIVIRNTSTTVIEDVGFQGTGFLDETHFEGASGIYYVNAWNNTLNRVQVMGFRIGVLYEGGANGVPKLPTASLQEPRVSGNSPWSSFSNSIRDSEIIQNQTNILGMDRSNALNLFNVTFGGGESYWGVRFINSYTLVIWGGDCEGIGDSLVPQGPEDGCVRLEDSVDFVHKGVHIEEAGPLPPDESGKTMRNLELLSLLVSIVAVVISAVALVRSRTLSRFRS